MNWNIDRKTMVRLLVRGAVFAAVLGAVAWFGLPKPDEGKVSRENSSAFLFRSMSTAASVRLYSEKPHYDFSPAFARIQKEFRDVEKLCSFFDPESELSRLNASAAEKPFPCSPELWDLLSASREYWKRTDGAFDISVSPLLELWGFYRKQGRVPSPREIDEVRKRTGLDKVRFDEEARTVFFSVPGMSLNLGGIAKGYALDRARDAVLNAYPEISAGFLDLGGNVLTFGRHAPFRAGIRSPVEPEKLLASVPLRSGSAIATSGGYERYIVADGKKYGHILDPKTGYPVSNCLSATVIASSGMESDALSTAFYIAGAGLAASFPDADVLLLSPDPGDPERFSLFRTGKDWEVDSCFRQDFPPAGKK